MFTGGPECAHWGHLAGHDPLLLTLLLPPLKNWPIDFTLSYLKPEMVLANLGPNMRVFYSQAYLILLLWDVCIGVRHIQTSFKGTKDGDLGLSIWFCLRTTVTWSSWTVVRLILTLLRHSLISWNSSFLNSFRVNSVWAVRNLALSHSMRQ